MKSILGVLLLLAGPPKGDPAGTDADAGKSYQVRPVAPLPTLAELARYPVGRVQAAGEIDSVLVSFGARGEKQVNVHLAGIGDGRGVLDPARIGEEVPAGRVAEASEKFAWRLAREYCREAVVDREVCVMTAKEPGPRRPAAGRPAGAKEYFLFRKADGLFVNLDPIAGGHAAHDASDATPHSEAFRRAEAAARAEHLGLWSDDLGEIPEVRELLQPGSSVTSGGSRGRALIEARKRGISARNELAKHLITRQMQEMHEQGLRNDARLQRERADRIRGMMSGRAIGGGLGGS